MRVAPSRTQAPASRRIVARELCCARDRKLTACEKIQSREARNRFGPGKGQGWACLSVFRYAVSPFRSPDERSDIRERWCGFAAVSRSRFAHLGYKLK